MKKYTLTLILALVSLGLYAQTNRNKTIINAALHGWEYEIKAGVNLGGTAPLPFYRDRSVCHCGSGALPVRVPQRHQMDEFRNRNGDPESIHRIYRSLCLPDHKDSTG